MNTVVTLSVVVTGFPVQLRRPKPLPGETLAQLVIRNHPQEWRICVERLETEFGISTDSAYRLRSGHLEVADPGMREQIMRFMNHRLPTRGRTLQDLAELRDTVKDLRYQSGFDLVEILWPRERNPSGDQSAERMAESMGAKVIQLPTGLPRAMDLASMLPHISGEFVWLVPGGTKLMPPLVVLSLERVLRHLTGSPRRALYTDNAFSIIYRVAALKELLRSGKTLPADLREMGRLMRESGYELAVDHDDNSVLCDLEEVYGGRSPVGQPRSDDTKT